MTIKIPVIKVIQNEWSMYIGTMKARQLYKIAEADRIRLETIEVPKYAGFQRPLVESRVDDIRDYLSTPISTFPNSIIVSIDSKHIKNWINSNDDKRISFLEIEEKPDVLTVIDGQHRAAALNLAPENFQVILTIFIDLVIIQSAEIFSRINSTQKAVNPSIAFQLFGYSDKRSPQKTAHDIAETLNKSEGSPFYKKLRMLGTKDEWSIGSLSQSTFAKTVMKLFTRNPTKDEYALLRGEDLEEYSNYPLRKYFRLNKDDEMLSIIWKFFYLVAKTWPKQWDDKNKESILGKTTGFSSFVEVLKKLLIKNDSTIIDSEIGYKRLKDSFLEIQDKYNKPEYKFIRENYPAGHQGVVKLRPQLIEDLKVKMSNNE